MAKTLDPIAKQRELKLTLLNMQILELIAAAADGLTTTEIKEKAAISMQLACHNLDKLKNSSLITKGNDKVYHITSAGRKVLPVKSI